MQTNRTETDQARPSRLSARVKDQGRNPKFLYRRSNSRRLQTILLVGLAVGLIAVLTRLALINIALSLILPAILIVPPIAWLLVVRWRFTFYAVVVVMVFEGMARNLTNQVTLLLFKDVLLGLIYLGYLLELRWKFIRVKSLGFFSVAYACLIVYCLIELLNPTLPDISVGVIGLKTLLYYVPLVYIAYEVLDTQEKIIKFSVVIFIFTFVTSAFGLYQFWGGPKIIQQFLGHRAVQNYGTNGELVSYKIPATFASASNFSGWLYISFSMAMGLLYSKTSRRMTYLSLVVVATTSVMFVVNSQRAGLVYVVLCFMLGTFSYSASGWLRTAKIALAALLVVLFVLAVFTEDNAIGSRFSEFTGGNGLQSYLISSPTDQITEQLEAISHGRFFGLGIGAGAPGARYVLGSAYQFVEAFSALQLYEIGPLGLLLALWVLAAIMTLTWRNFRQTRGQPLHNFIFYIFVWMCYMLVNSITYAPLAIPPAGLFYWILPGVALRLWQIAKNPTAPETIMTPPPPASRLQTDLAFSGNFQPGPAPEESSV